MVVYDITNRRSFEQAKAWKQDLDQKVYLPNSETLPCILVANKVKCYNHIVQIESPGAELLANTVGVLLPVLYALMML